MAIEVTWDSPDNTVMCFAPAGSWDWQSFYDKTDHMYDLIRSVNHDVDVIIDVRASLIPAGNILWHFQSILRRTPKNARSYVFVGAGEVQESMVSLLLRVVPAGIGEMLFFVDTLQQAHELIFDIRESLTSSV